MLKYLLRLVFLGICWNFLTTTSFAANPAALVGIVKVSPLSSPEACYSLEREGIRVEPLTHDMRVMRGDVITPKPGVKITLVYTNTGCDDKEITERTTVTECIKQTSLWGKFVRNFEKMAVGPKLKPIQTMVMRRKTSCLPGQPFRVSPCPANGSTLLPDEPLLFRWNKSGTDLCAKARLVIIPDKGSLKNRLVEQEIRVGELVEVDISPVKSKLQAGMAYEWFVMTADGTKIISDRYRFRILDRDVARPIQDKLQEIHSLYQYQEPYLAQALYLQLLTSDSTNLDLYADSLRLILAHIESKGTSTFIPVELIDRIYNHFGQDR